MMDNRIRPSGHYATFDGIEYGAGGVHEGNVVLTAFGDGPPPAGFKSAKQPGIAGKRIVPRGELQKYVHVKTTCSWHGEGPFVLEAVLGSTVYLSYRGTNGKYLSEQPGGARGDMDDFDTVLDISEVENIREEVTEK